MKLGRERPGMKEFSKVWTLNEIAQDLGFTRCNWAREVRTYATVDLRKFPNQRRS